MAIKWFKNCSFLRIVFIDIFYQDELKIQFHKVCMCVVEFFAYNKYNLQHTNIKKKFIYLYIYYIYTYTYM